MERQNAYLCGAALFALFLTPQISLAEEAGAYGIEEVLVTARKREETAQSVPIPITAMTAEDLRDRASWAMRDLERPASDRPGSRSGIPARLLVRPARGGRRHLHQGRGADPATSSRSVPTTW